MIFIRTSLIEWIPCWKRIGRTFHPIALEKIHLMLADRFPAGYHGADTLGDRQTRFLVVLNVEREQAVDISLDGKPGFLLEQGYNDRLFGARLPLLIAAERDHEHDGQYHAGPTHDRLSRLKTCLDIL
jgi:hypothetical protein